MNPRAILAVVVATAAVAQAAATVTAPTPSVVSLVVTGAMPVTLIVGPDGSTTLGANATSARTSVTGGTVATLSANTSTLRSGLASDHRVRLTLVQASGATGECVECTIQLRQGGSTSTQLQYASGSLQQSQGAWVTLPAGGDLALWTLARATIVADTDAVLDYELEVAPASSASPALVLYAMRVTFRV